MLHWSTEHTERPGKDRPAIARRMVQRRHSFRVLPCIRWTRILALILVPTLSPYARGADGRLPPVDSHGSPHAAFRSDVGPYGETIRPQAYEQYGGGQTYPADEVEPLFDAPADSSPFDGTPVNDQPRSLPGARDGVFQGGLMSATWLAGSDLQMVDALTQASFGLPFPSREAPVVFTPGYGLHLLDGPTGLDVPSQLHDAWLETRFPRQLTEKLLLDVAVAAGYYSDFERRSDDAIRITGRAVAIYDWSPVTKLVLGVAYLDRNDVSILPVAGVTWTPSPDRRIELVFPRPRFAWRTYRFDQLDPSGAEWWYYISGEFGGGTWAVVRADDSLDELTYQDYRVIFGLERKPTGLTPSRLEVGYVFGRALEYASSDQEYEVDSTALARLVWGF